MPTYLFRGTNAAGSHGHEHVEAGDLGEARRLLEAQGYRDIEFYSDENADLIRQTVRADCNVPPRPDWTAEDEIASRKRRGVPAKLWWALKQHALAFGLLGLWNFNSLHAARPLAWRDWLGFGSTIAYLVYFGVITAPMVIFNQLLEASVWGDWPAVRRWIAIGRIHRGLLRYGLPLREMAIREAYADAAEGNLSKALASMEAIRVQHKVPIAIHLTRLSSVYEYAGEYRRKVECLEEAAAKGAGGVSEWIDLASARIRRLRDVAGAKAALAHTAGKEMPLLPKAAYTRCLGMIAVEEGRYTEANRLLAAALEQLRNHGGTPLLQAWIWESEAYQAIALAGAGDQAAGRRVLLGVVKWLEARHETELLARCWEAVG